MSDARRATFPFDTPERKKARNTPNKREKRDTTNKYRQIVLSWLQAKFSLKTTGSISKQSVYEDYLQMCRVNNLETTSAAVFGKLLHKAFPTVKTTRKGPRGNAKHHYKFLGVKEDATSTSTPFEVKFVETTKDHKGKDQKEEGTLLLKNTPTIQISSTPPDTEVKKDKQSMFFHFEDWVKPKPSTPPTSPSSEAHLNLPPVNQKRQRSPSIEQATAEDQQSQPQSQVQRLKTKRRGNSLGGLLQRGRALRGRGRARSEPYSSNRDAVSPPFVEQETSTAVPELTPLRTVSATELAQKDKLDTFDPESSGRLHCPSERSVSLDDIRFSDSRFFAEISDEEDLLEDDSSFFSSPLSPLSPRSSPSFWGIGAETEAIVPLPVGTNSSAEQQPELKEQQQQQLTPHYADEPYSMYTIGEEEPTSPKTSMQTPQQIQPEAMEIPMPTPPTSPPPGPSAPLELLDMFWQDELFRSQGPFAALEIRSDDEDDHRDRHRHTGGELRDPFAVFLGNPQTEPSVAPFSYPQQPQHRPHQSYPRVEFQYVQTTKVPSRTKHSSPKVDSKKSHHVQHQQQQPPPQQHQQIQQQPHPPQQQRIQQQQLQPQIQWRVPQIAVGKPPQVDQSHTQPELPSPESRQRQSRRKKHKKKKEKDRGKDKERDKGKEKEKEKEKKHKTKSREKRHHDKHSRGKLTSSSSSNSSSSSSNSPSTSPVKGRQTTQQSPLLSMPLFPRISTTAALPSAEMALVQRFPFHPALPPFFFDLTPFNSDEALSVALFEEALRTFWLCLFVLVCNMAAQEIEPLVRKFWLEFHKIASFLNDTRFCLQFSTIERILFSSLCDIMMSNPSKVPEREWAGYMKTASQCFLMWWQASEDVGHLVNDAQRFLGDRQAILESFCRTLFNRANFVETLLP